LSLPLSIDINGIIASAKMHNIDQYWIDILERYNIKQTTNTDEKKAQEDLLEAVNTESLIDVTCILSLPLTINADDASRRATNKLTELLGDILGGVASVPTPLVEISSSLYTYRERVSGLLPSIFNAALNDGNVFTVQYLLQSSRMTITKDHLDKVKKLFMRLSTASVNRGASLDLHRLAIYGKNLLKDYREIGRILRDYLGMYSGELRISKNGLAIPDLPPELLPVLGSFQCSNNQ
jgi:hypothetical protein